MAVFYVFHISDKHINDCLEAIRYICNPAAKQRAHVTVRGPYTKRIDISAINEKLVDKSLTLYKVGNFFEFSQPTVFFRCYSSELRRIWYKPDYPYNPHITIYDGTSLAFARSVFDIANRFDFNFVVKATELEPLMSSRGQKSMSLSMNLDDREVADILGFSIDLERVAEWSVDTRLEALNKLFAHLSKLSFSRSSEFFALRARLDRCLSPETVESSLLMQLYRVLERVGKEKRVWDPDHIIPLLLRSGRPMATESGYEKLNDSEKEELRMYYLDALKIIPKATSYGPAF